MRTLRERGLYQSEDFIRIRRYIFLTGSKVFNTARKSRQQKSLWQSTLYLRKRGNIGLIGVLVWDPLWPLFTACRPTLYRILGHTQLCSPRVLFHLMCNLIHCMFFIRTTAKAKIRCFVLLYLRHDLINLHNSETRKKQNVGLNQATTNKTFWILLPLCLT